jgi:dienelactone hydrolase
VSRADLLIQAERLTLDMRLVMPKGPGPFPVVIQMHGCGGITRLQHRYAEAAAEAGVAAIVLDSLAPRNIGRLEAQLTVCSGARFRGAERAGDLLAMLAWLEEQPWADAERVAAAGWSHGAWAVMEALVGVPSSAAMAPALAQLKAAILFYPYAGPLARTASRGWGPYAPKVYGLVCGRDAVVGSTLPLRALRRLEADGLDVQLLELPEATHCFDDDQAGDVRTRYRPDYTAQATDFFLAALRESFSASVPHSSR